MDQQPLIVATDFSGIGSPEEALKRLQVNHKIAFACDIDKYAKLSYLQNHSPEVFYDNILFRDNKDAAYSDLYCFGFPCQAFSISGKRLGFEDTRGTLFFNALEYISTHRPRVFIAENVKGLLSHDKPKGSKSKYGRTFGVIRDALGITMNGQHNLYKYDDCVNYHIHFQVLNTKDYGLPQNRERIFIVGFRDEADAMNFRFPKKIILQKRLKDILEKQVDEKYYLSEKMINYLLGRKDNFNNGKINFKGSNVIASTLTKSSHSLDISDNIIYEENKRNRITSDTSDTSDIAPTILANQAKQSTDSVYIAETGKGDKKQVIVVNDNGEIKEQDGFNALDANYGKGIDNHGQRSLIMESKDFAFRGRENEEGKIQQQAEFRKDDVTNTITSVQKDNLVAEIDNTDYSITCECGFTFTAKLHEKCPCCLKITTGVTNEIPLENSILFVKENTAKGYTEAMPGDSINFSNPTSKTRRGRVGKQIAQTLDTACNQAVLLPLFDTQNNADAERIYDSEGISRTLKSEGGGGGAKTGLYLTGTRIRRLTPKECFRLQGHSDEFFEKCALVNSDTQLYKQAGNAINTDTFMHLLIQILITINIPFII